ncbi:MAG TPA: DinB family protein [Anaerolineales bacterium]|nr:DinB family protein [Anaerolineales bacterium]
MSVKDELRAEILETREAFHRLLAEIPDKAFSEPSDNPAWTIGELLFHMSLAPRFVVTDLRFIISRPWLAKIFTILIPISLFNRLNEVFTRYGSRNLNRTFLAEQYDRAHARALESLEELQEADFERALPYPGYDAMLSGVVTVERLYRYLKLHFQAHAGQIRERLNGILV